MPIIDIPHGTQPTSDRMALALSELFWMTAMTKERQRGHWIPVDSRQWRSLLGSRYTQVLREAEKLGFIEVNHRYAPDRFPKSFRLSARYRTPRSDPYRTNSAPATNIRLRDGDHVGRWLVSRFPLVELPPGDLGTGWTSFQTTQLRAQRYYATRCQYGRFHSSFTGLRRDVRRRLRTIHGQPLVEIDVRNCQPLLIGHQALEWHRTSARRSSSISSSVVTSSQPHTPLRTHLLPYVAHGGAVDDFIERCERGLIYDRMLELCDDLTLRQFWPVRFGPWLPPDRPLTRNDVKQQFLILLFARNATMFRLPLFQVLQREWPGVAAYVEHTKRVEYQELARGAQRRESEIMIDGVAASCARFQTSPDFILLTIHDAILTTPDQADFVCEMIRAEFQRWGLRPSLQVSDREVIV